MGCTDKALDAATFDEKLLLEGKWKTREFNNIEQWVKKTGEEKKSEASKLIGFLIETLLSEDFSPRGKQFSKNLGEMFFRLEEIIETTKGGIARKFYRDHLNHMLRVALLSRAAARKVKSFDLNENDIKLVTIAALFHDIAYPLAEIDKIYGEITVAMKKCYRSIKYPETIVSYDMTIVTQLLQNLNLLPGMKLSDLGDYFAAHNHGLLGAMEFLQNVKEGVVHKYTNVIDAIVYHDPDFNKSIVLMDKKILSLLIICDEMQDWGRPATFEKEPTISEIKDFRLTNNRICGRFVWDKTSIVSPLRQIHSKKKSLERLIFSGSKKNLTVNLHFVLPEYLCLDYHGFEAFLQELFVLWKIPASIFHDFSRGIDVKVYEQIYFGLAAENEDSLTMALVEKKLCQTSPITEPLFLSSTRNEALYVCASSGAPQELKLALDTNGFGMTLTGAEKPVDGELLCQQEDRAIDISRRIVGELLIFNLALEYRYFRQRGKGKDVFGSMVPRDKIGDFLTKQKVAEDKIKLVQATDDIRECLKRQGFYVFRQK